MGSSEMLSGRKLILPIFTSQQMLGRPFVRGKDEHGEYISCRLRNRNTSKFYGWYVLVSPEDFPLMQDFNWCAAQSNSVHGSTTRGIEVRRREVISGKNYSIMLSREIWQRIYPGDVPPYIYRLGHPLDFRRIKLSQFPSAVSARGVVRCGNGWQVQIVIKGEATYIGRAVCVDEGYRMFNRHLKKVKEENPTDARIQAMPYNKVEPLF